MREKAFRIGARVLLWWSALTIVIIAVLMVAVSTRAAYAQGQTSPLQEDSFENGAYSIACRDKIKGSCSRLLEFLLLIDLERNRLLEEAERKGRNPTLKHGNI